MFTFDRSVVGPLLFETGKCGPHRARPLCPPRGRLKKLDGALCIVSSTGSPSESRTESRPSRYIGQQPRPEKGPSPGARSDTRLPIDRRSVGSPRGRHRRVLDGLVPAAERVDERVQQRRSGIANRLWSLRKNLLGAPRRAKIQVVQRDDRLFFESRWHTRRFEHSPARARPSVRRLSMMYVRPTNGPAVRSTVPFLSISRTDLRRRSLSSSFIAMPSTTHPKTLRVEWCGARTVSV